MSVRADYELVVDLGMSVLEVLAHLSMQKVVLSPLALLQEFVEASTFCLVVFCSGVDSTAYLLLSGSSVKEDIIDNIFGALIANGPIYGKIGVEGEITDFAADIARAFANRL